MEKKPRKPGSGGARSGAGRPNKYGEDTVMYYCRVPLSKRNEVDKLVKKFIKKFEEKK